MNPIILKRPRESADGGVLVKKVELNYTYHNAGCSQTHYLHPALLGVITSHPCGADDAVKCEGAFIESKALTAARQAYEALLEAELALHLNQDPSEQRAAQAARERSLGAETTPQREGE